MSTIQIPYNFVARDYQKALYNAVMGGCKRAVAVWHRRAGKDKVFINILAGKALERVGTYFYILPYYTQARKIIWEGFDKNGFPNINHFPPQLVKRRSNQEMVLELINGSVVRFLGSDNIDSIVGTNPIGIVFSEFSLHKIEAWNYLRPILLENEGWAIFNGTPRGKNHLYKMLETAKSNPDWFWQVLTIDDTHVMTPQQVEEEIRMGMPRAMALQEFYCSFDAAMTGAYYGEVMAELDQNGRLTNVPYDPALPVNTGWDLGISDTLVIWFFQQTASGAIKFIDIIADNGKPLQYYVNLMRQKPYVYGYHILPHDVRQRELASGMSRLDTLRSLGLNDIVVANKLSIEDGINATRNILGKAWFDDVRCAKGIEALKQYRADYDMNSDTYGKPIHDWSSHYADAMRMIGVGLRDTFEGPRQAYATGVDYDPLRIDNPRYRIKKVLEDERGTRPEYWEAF